MGRMIHVSFCAFVAILSIQLLSIVTFDRIVHNNDLAYPSRSLLNDRAEYRRLQRQNEQLAQNIRNLNATAIYRLQEVHHLRNEMDNLTQDLGAARAELSRMHALVDANNNDNGKKQIQKGHAEQLRPASNDSKNERSLIFMHIGKAGGTSFDQLGENITRDAGYDSYIGSKHFDWNGVQKFQEYKQSQSRRKSDVVMMLRHPVDRAISHFHFYKKQNFAKGMKITRQNLTEYLFDGDVQNLLDTRDVWQDGQAGVSWLTGTHIGNWAGCPKNQVEIREERAKNATAMMHLAAERLTNEVKWFGLLEDLNRSMELLRHELHLNHTPIMQHANANVINKKRPKPIVTAEERNALASLMPQDLWLYEYARSLFDAKWEAYATGNAFKAPELPPLPEIRCSSTRFQLNCSSGPLATHY